MCTIYNNIQALCDERGIKPGKMCVDVGISKSILTGLKNGTKKNIQTDTAQKIAEYFGVSVGYLLGQEEKNKPTVNDDELPDSVQELLAFARTIPADKAGNILRAMKGFLGDD